MSTHALRAALIAATLLVSAGGMARAADTFETAVERAYDLYRPALFKTSQASTAEATKATEAALAAWTEVETKWSSPPPPAPFTADARFVETVHAVGDVIRRGAAEMKAGDGAKAHETLEGVRELLSDLRARNGVVSWHDRVDAYHTAMETVMNAKYEGSTLDQPARDVLRDRLTVLDRQFGEMSAAVPEAHKGTPDFAPAIQSIKSSIDGLRAAAQGGDPQAVAKAANALKQPYAKFFVKFG